MNGDTFDWIMAVICIVCAVLLLSGHGDGLMKMFGAGSTQQLSMKVEKKRTKEQEQRSQKAIGAYCLLLAVCEVSLALFGATYKIVPIISIIAGLGGLIGVVAYLKKKF